MSLYGLRSKLLNECVRNRSSFLKTIHADRSFSKNLIISVINGGSAGSNTKLQAFVDDIKAGVEYMCNLDEYIYIAKYCNEQYKDSPNINGKIISRILQVQEDALLQAYQRWCHTKNYINLDTNEISLIFDGFQLLKTNNIGDAELRELQEYALERTGFDVALAIKPFDNLLELPENYNILPLHREYIERFINRVDEIANDDFIYHNFITPAIESKGTDLQLGNLIYQIFCDTIYYDDKVEKWYYYDIHNVWHQASNIDFFKYTIQTLLFNIFKFYDDKNINKVKEISKIKTVNTEITLEIAKKRKELALLEKAEIRTHKLTEDKRIKKLLKTLSVTDANNPIVSIEYLPSPAVIEYRSAIDDLISKLNNDVDTDIKKYEVTATQLFWVLKTVQNQQSIENAIKTIRPQFQYSGFYTDVLDKNGYLFAFCDKVHDLRTGVRRPIKITDYIMNTTGYASPTNINTSSRVFLEDYFKQIFPDGDNRDFLLDACSSMVCGEKLEQYGMFHTGSGSNSKSTFFAMIAKALGGYWEWLSPEVLTKTKKGANDTCSLHLAKGKRGIGMNEPEENEKIQTSNLKRLCDTSVCSIKSRPLYSESIEFAITWLICMLCNNKPLLNSCDNGTGRRIRVLEWRMKFVENPDPNNKYQAPMDATFIRIVESDVIRDAMIEFMLERWDTRISKMNTIPVPSDVIKASQSYVTDSNIVLGFMLQYYEFTNNTKDKVKSRDLLNHYDQNFPEDKNSSSKFKNDILAIGSGIESKRLKTGIYFTGIKRREITNDDETDDEKYDD